MKTNEGIISLRRFEVDEKLNKLKALQAMQDDFKSMAQDLDRQIKMEEQRAGVSDVSHFAYPPFARAARDRRTNLLASIDELQPRIEQAQKEYDDVKAALDKLLASQGGTRQPQPESRLRRGKYARASFSRGVAVGDMGR